MKIRIFDNEGLTIDRYTIVFLKRKTNDKDNIYECFSFNSTPSSPQGFGQWGECILDEWDNKHLGEEIQMRDLSISLRKFLKTIF